MRGAERAHCFEAAGRDNGERPDAEWFAMALVKTQRTAGSEVCKFSDISPSAFELSKFRIRAWYYRLGGWYMFSKLFLNPLQNNCGKEVTAITATGGSAFGKARERGKNPFVASRTWSIPSFLLTMPPRLNAPIVPQCVSCLRSYLDSSFLGCWLPLRHQVRGAKTRTDPIHQPGTVVVQLNRHLNGWGKEGSCIPYTI